MIAYKIIIEDLICVRFTDLFNGLLAKLVDCLNLDEVCPASEISFRGQISKQRLVGLLEHALHLTKGHFEEVFHVIVLVQDLQLLTRQHSKKIWVLLLKLLKVLNLELFEINRVVVVDSFKNGCRFF